MLRGTHQPRVREDSTGSIAYDLVRGAFFLFGFPHNAFGSFDITSKCNLRCRHCYYFTQSHPDDLADQQWLDLMAGLKSKSWFRFPFLQASWVGGEPLLRKDLIEKLRGYFRFNTIVTNGTLPLPDWPDVRFYVSVDGPAEVHDEIRGKPGLHARIKKNIARSDLDITIACCINRLNARHIEDMVREWDRSTVSHMVFDFYTPMLGQEDDLYLTPPEKDTICDLLIELRRIYGDFIVVPESTFRLMKSDISQKVTSRCVFRDKGFAYAANGEPKPKCTLGKRADCSRCGCVVPYYIASLTWRRFVLADWYRQIVHRNRARPV